MPAAKLRNPSSFSYIFPTVCLTALLHNPHHQHHTSSWTLSRVQKPLESHGPVSLATASILAIFSTKALLGTRQPLLGNRL